MRVHRSYKCQNDKQKMRYLLFNWRVQDWITCNNSFFNWVWKRFLFQRIIQVTADIYTHINFNWEVKQSPMRIDEKRPSCTISQVCNPRYHWYDDDTHVFPFFFCFLAMNGNEIIINIERQKKKKDTHHHHKRPFFRSLYSIINYHHCMQQAS